MDKYDASNDHYCYPASSVLRNKLGITSMGDLEVAEREITEVTHGRVQYVAPPYTLESLQVIHRALFSDLYDWAGTVRNVDISKQATRFCTNSRIEAEARRCFKDLADDGWLKGLDHATFCQKLAMHYCELNMIHPFREGNGRVQRVLFEQLALSAGYELNWAGVDPDEWIAANVNGVLADYRAMEKIFLRVARPG